MYKTTIRMYRKADIDLIQGLKKEFNECSLSRALIWCARDYYRQKERLEILHNAVTTKKEIDSKAIEKAFG